MTAAFTTAYPFAATWPVMDMSAASNLLARKASQKAGRDMRIMDLQLLLTMLSTQQLAGFTAQRVREGNLPELAGNQPARMAEIFAPLSANPILPKGILGAFHAGVAARLSMGNDSKDDVYLGT